MSARERDDKVRDDAHGDVRDNVWHKSTEGTRYLDEGAVEPVTRIANAFLAGVERVMVGKTDVAELVLVALLSEGHVLLEDVPGLGKTMLAKAASVSLGCRFQRIQCTPDLLPSDVTGVQFYDQHSGTFTFRPGPLMSNLVLVDEINRATPRTQSALLEAMQEQQITVDVETVPLPGPFMLMATQNPVELEGTFPLPEAQLDRFLFRLRMGYPTFEQEGEILSRFQEEDPLPGLSPVAEADELIVLQDLCRRVYVAPTVRDYIVALVRGTREDVDVRLGASPRASLGLQRAAQSLAAVRGRAYILPDDVKYVATPVLAHRLIVKTEARLRGRVAEAVVEELLSSVPVPVEA
ncbi:MAG: MoxR family ATPase [Actinobacteria bacterium]|nr:MoxR family ATPase [Actinomycetota bacterium]